MASPNTGPRLPETFILLAGLGGAVVLWLARDVMSLEIVFRIVLTLMWLGAWTLAAFGAGAPLFRKIVKTERFAAVDIPVILLTGAGFLATSATLFALAGIFNAPVLIGVLLIASVSGVWECRRHWAGITSEFSFAVPLSAWVLLAAGAALIPVLSAPPVMYDTLNYHLAFPDHWLEAGRFVEFPRHGFAYYPSSYGMAYSFALVTVGPWGGTAIHFWFGVVACLTVAALATRLSGRTTAVWAAAAFGLTPAVLEVATYAAADLAVAAWGGAAFAALFVGSDSSNPGRTQWGLSGFLLGCAVAAKYLAITTVFLPLGAAALPLLVKGGRRQALKSAAAVAAGASLPVLPWLIRNALWTGNPLYPYLQRILGGAQTEMSISVHLAQIGGTEPWTLQWALQSLVALPLRTIQPLDQGGFLGPHWLILLPVACVVSWRLRDRTMVQSLWLYVIVGLVTWGSLVQMARFALPVLLVAAPLAGLAATALTASTRPMIRAGFRGLLVFVLLWNSTMMATTQNLDRLAVAAGQLSPDAYKRSWISYYPVLETINHQLPPGSKILLVGEPRSLYFEPQVVVEDPFRQPYLVHLALSGLTAEGIARELQEKGVTHIVVSTVEMPLSARLRGVEDYWDPASPNQRAEIDGFLTKKVQRLAGGNGLWIGRITDF